MFYRRQQRALELLKEGDFRRDAGYLGLGQEIPADCSVNIYFLADLKRDLNASATAATAPHSSKPPLWAEKFIWALMPSALALPGLLSSTTTLRSFSRQTPPERV